MQQHSSFKLAVSLKTILKRALLGLMLLACIVLFLLSIKQEGFAASIRSGVSEFFQPIVSLFATPVSIGKSGLSGVDRFFNSYEENKTLREENNALLIWQQRATTLLQENKGLKKINNIEARPELPFISGLVTSMEGGQYREAVLINVGHEDGVADNLAVINEAGFVGRIITTQPHSSWLLLLNDVNSRIPIRNIRNGERAILAGGKGDFLNLQFLAKDADFQAGDTMVTAADGAVLPDGLPVGTIMVESKNTPTLRPFVRPSQLHYVRILGASKDTEPQKLEAE